jgi:acyl-CoA synthetase (AMP-forming)/AMP-acid ligase II
MRLIDFFDRSARFFGDRACLIDATQAITYRGVQDRTYELSDALTGLDTADAAKFGVLAPNCVEAMVAILAILRRNAVWVPVNTRSTAEELRSFLMLVDCGVLLVHDSLMELGISAAQGTRCRVIRLTNLVSAASSRGSTSRGEHPASHPDDVCSVFSTGGTTGKPKAAMWTHRNWETLIANFLADIHHTGAPMNLIAAPLTHAAGVVALTMLVVGATTVLIPRADASLIMESIQEHRVTTLYLPPTVIYNMLAHTKVREYDYSSLQNFIYAAAPMSEAKLKLAMEIFGPVMVQTFGQAEAPMVCTILTRQDHIDALSQGHHHRLMSCGRPGLLTEISIMNDDGDLLPVGESGEIVVKGDLVTPGYMNDAAATAASRCRGWLRTGDIGRQDTDGYVYITDRKRDMIISGGFNVYPSEIEQVLWSHHAVRDCAVVGAPDEKWGESVVAVVELRDGERVDEGTLIALCKSRLGGVKAPKAIEFWPELPRSPVGKVLKRAIRDHFWAGKERKLSV